MLRPNNGVFFNHLSTRVFHEQVDKFQRHSWHPLFTSDFEEAHNLFAPSDADDKTRIYRRLAKEGAKYHIGMVYSTQSVTSVSKDLLGQNGEFFSLFIWRLRTR